MSLCNPCNTLFSWRPVGPSQKFRVGSPVPSVAELSAKKSNESCPFCAFLRLSFPKAEARYVEDIFVARKQDWNADHGYDVYLENPSATLFRNFNHQPFPAVVRKAGQTGGPYLELLFAPESRASLSEGVDAQIANRYQNGLEASRLVLIFALVTLIRVKASKPSSSGFLNVTALTRDAKLSQQSPMHALAHGQPAFWMFWASVMIPSPKIPFVWSSALQQQKAEIM
jgi:hypothetical protein